MKNCKTQIYNLEGQCAQIIQTIEKLLAPNLQEAHFVRILTNAARSLDHSVTELHYLSKDLREHHLTEASTMLSAIKVDFTSFSKTMWGEYIQPISAKTVQLTKATIEKAKAFLLNVLQTLKQDMKNLLSADKALHSENPHSKNFIRAQVVHKKYEGKKKEDDKVKDKAS